MQQLSAQFRERTQVLRNEDGVAIVAVMLILVLLTIVGIASTNVSNTEVTIAGNHALYQQNFYKAEGATIEAIDKLEGILDPDNPIETWLENTVGEVTLADIRGTALWGGGSVNGTSPQSATNLDGTQFVVVHEGIVSGSSLGIGVSKLHQYAVYGRTTSATRGGVTVVNIGYLMGF